MFRGFSGSGKTIMAGATRLFNQGMVELTYYLKPRVLMTHIAGFAGRYMRARFAARDNTVMAAITVAWRAFKDRVDVTIFTRYKLMHAFQRKTGSNVIEIVYERIGCRGRCDNA